MDLNGPDDKDSLLKAFATGRGWGWGGLWRKKSLSFIERCENVRDPY
jgi:hypothetical protein